MSNGNERTNAGETTTANFTSMAAVPEHPQWNAKQPVQVAIANWINSCGRQDEMTIEDIVDACWMLEPVVSYLTDQDYQADGTTPIFDFRKQLVRMYISQSLRHYIDAVVIASVPK